VNQQIESVQILKDRCDSDPVAGIKNTIQDLMARFPVAGTVLPAE